MILVIDNYDSFTFNLVHYLIVLGADVRVERNDALTAAEALASEASAFLISPGPCTPKEAGVSLDLVAKTSPVCHDGSGLFADLPSPLTATRYHSLEVVDIPECLAVNATSDDGAVMGFRHRALPIHAVQFHPESVATEYGYELLANFLAIAGLATSASRAPAPFLHPFQTSIGQARGTW